MTDSIAAICPHCDAYLAKTMATLGFVHATATVEKKEPTLGFADDLRARYKTKREAKIAIAMAVIREKCQKAADDCVNPARIGLYCEHIYVSFSKDVIEEACTRLARECASSPPITYTVVMASDDLFSAPTSVRISY